MDIKQLKFAYAPKENFIDIDELVIKENKITTIIGPNGCGKSTLLNLIAKQQKPTAGTIKIDDRDVDSFSRKEFAKKIAIVYQQNEAPEQFTIRDLVKVGRYPYRKGMNGLSEADLKAIDHAIDITGLKDLEEKRLVELSGGQRQRAWIALALAQETDYLLLDEPTTYLDLHHQYEILDCVEKLNTMKNITIVMVLHDLNQAFQYSDEIVMMQRGKIVNAGPANELMDESLIKDIFRIDVQLIEDRHQTMQLLPLKK